MQKEESPIFFRIFDPKLLRSLDGRNHAIVIPESLARGIAVIRIASVRWLSHLALKQNLVLVDPVFVALRFKSRDWHSLVQHLFHVEMRNGLGESIALAER